NSQPTTIDSLLAELNTAFSNYIGILTQELALRIAISNVLGDATSPDQLSAEARAQYNLLQANVATLLNGLTPRRFYAPFVQEITRLRSEIQRLTGIPFPSQRSGDFFFAFENLEDHSVLRGRTSNPADLANLFLGPNA